jgi:hypothetical protein
MKLVVLFFISFAIISCSNKLGSTASKSYFKNDSGLEVNINFTENISLLNSKILNLKNGERKVFDNCFAEDVSKFICIPITVDTKDSVVIIFSDLKRITYYSTLTQGTNPSAIPYNNLRNILNFSNWEKLIIEDSKKRYETEFNFVITREDYLKAK